jgi:hypothetical protein
MAEKSNDWPAAAVAITILFLIGAVTVSAILRCDTLNEALQIWQAMGTIVGLVTGAFVTFFFTRGAVDNAQHQARNAMELAALQDRRADATQQALTKVAGLLPSEQWTSLQQDPVVRMATSMNGEGNSAAPIASR